MAATLCENNDTSVTPYGIVVATMIDSAGAEGVHTGGNSCPTFCTSTLINSAHHGGVGGYCHHAGGHSHGTHHVCAVCALCTSVHTTYGDAYAV